MAKYAYVRVSALDQNETRQLDAMTVLKIPPQNIFIEKLSGKNTQRPRLQALLAAVQFGDTITVESISRFARNTRALLELVEQLTVKGVEFISLKERIDTTTPTGKFMLTVFGAVAELERGYLLQRQAEGIAAARARGKHLGRPVKKPPKNLGNLIKRWESKEILLQKVLDGCGGVCAAAFYKWLAEYRSIKGKKR
jgi:DNA invertase Pin-like site-specific DNA recombinase